jgi:hypothetical protein
LQQTIASLLGFFVLLAVGIVGLTIGFKGPDFSQTRRARMVRQEWSLIGLVVGAVVGIAVLAPLVLSFGFSLFTGGSIDIPNLTLSVVISGIISVVISIVFYQINIKIAKGFLRKAEV